MMPYSANDSVKIYYETAGDGQALLLIMGIGNSAEGWRAHFPVFSQKFKTIIFDNRGTGRSDKPDVPYTMEMNADDILSILKELKIEKTHICGVSLGGLIAQEFYHKYPDKVLSLTLISSGVGAGDPAFIYPEEWVLKLFQMEKTESNLKERIEKSIQALFYPDFIQKNPNLADNLIAASKKFPQPEYAYKRQLESSIIKNLNSPRLKNIKVPVLIIHGKNDLISSIGNSEYLHKNIPHSELVVLEEAGHMVYIEKYNEVIQKMLDFLNRVN